MSTENYCFCELAPLYVLGLLNQDEQSWVEAQVANCPELAEELACYGDALAAIPYAAPPAALAPEVKDRLFQRLITQPIDSRPQAEVVAQESTAQPKPLEPKPDLAWVMRSQALKWQPYLSPGVTIALLYTDLQKQEVVGLLRAAPQSQSPLHRHANVEEIFLLEGDLTIGEDVYQAGDYLRSIPGSAHAPYTQQGCVLFFRTSMLDEYPGKPLSIAARTFVPLVSKVVHLGNAIGDWLKSHRR